MPGTKVKWPQQVKAAKSQWGKLSEAELLKSDGDAEQLSRLVQQRYNMAPDVANNQVKSFLNRSSNA
ncbi:MAG: general stress protein CsbD [Alkalimonas sp.]|nr:general stress protein CsbD [Alkalimonas sp.]